MSDYKYYLSKLSAAASSEARRAELMVKVENQAEKHISQLALHPELIGELLEAGKLPYSIFSGRTELMAYVLEDYPDPEEFVSNAAAVAGALTEGQAEQYYRVAHARGVHDPMLGDVIGRIVSPRRLNRMQRESNPSLDVEKLVAGVRAMHPDSIALKFSDYVETGAYLAEGEFPESSALDEEELHDYVFLRIHPRGKGARSPSLSFDFSLLNDVSARLAHNLISPEGPVTPSSVPAETYELLCRAVISDPIWAAEHILSKSKQHILISDAGIWLGGDFEFFSVQDPHLREELALAFEPSATASK